MKRLLIILFFLTYSLQTQEAGHKVTYLLVTEPLRPFDRLWEAVCQVESGGDPLAIGDKHLKKHSFGIAQIREVRLRDYNRRASANYSTDDLFDVEVSREIFYFYCEGDLESIAKSWNGSGPATEVYWEKVSKMLQNR